MVVYSIVIYFIYFGLLIYIIPSSALNFDLYERKFRLLPSWFKLISIFWLVLAIIAVVVFRDAIPNRKEVLISVFNFSLFITFFSRQKFEDEFSEQIRFKAFTYSFVSFVAVIGALSVGRIADLEGREWSNLIVQGFMGGGLLVATLYFYFTLYKFRKEDN